MITEVTCSADLCTWGMSNIATKWNTDHLIGEREPLHWLWHMLTCDFIMEMYTRYVYREQSFIYEKYTHFQERNFPPIGGGN